MDEQLYRSFSEIEVLLFKKNLYIIEHRRVKSLLLVSDYA